LVSGFQVVIETHLQKGADLVIGIEGKAVPIGDENKKDVEQELMVGKSAPEPIPEEPMFDGGEASLNGA
jgi:hypothetical protein